MIALISVVGVCLPPPRLRAGHWIGLSFLAWCLLSFAWTYGPYEGVDRMAKFGFMAGMFMIGGRLADTRSVYVGAAFGFAVNSAIVIAQWFGWDGITQGYAPSGLFMNKNFLAEAASLVLIAIVAADIARNKKMILIAAMLPCIVVPMIPLGGEGGTFGGFNALAGIGAAVVVWLWTKSRGMAAMLTLVGIATAALLIWQGYNGAAMSERFQIWQYTINGMTWRGNGIGSFFTTFPAHAPAYDLMHWRPMHTHNDYLELIYELGPGAFLYLAIMALAMCGPAGPEKFVLAAFLAEGVFDFPLAYPVPAALAALAAGRLCDSRVRLRVGAWLGRANARYGFLFSRSTAGGVALPASVQTGISVRSQVSGWTGRILRALPLEGFTPRRHCRNSARFDDRSIGF